VEKVDETGGEVSVVAMNKDDGDDVIATLTDTDIITASAEMYVHAKFPEHIQSNWLRSKTLSITHRPNWNDVRIVRALLSLLQTALHNERTTHFSLKETVRSILLDEVYPWEEEEEATVSTNDN
jgi:hypothetical protein